MAATKKSSGKLPVEIPGISEIKEMVEERLSGLEKRLENALVPQHINMPERPESYFAPVVAGPDPGNVAALSPYEKEVRRAGFNKGLEVGMYLGAGIALVAILRALR